jgi:hypothetical protein
MYHASRELAAHSHKDAAIDMAKQAAAWYKHRLEAGKPSPRLRSAYAAALLLGGDCTQALQIRKDLLNDREDSISAQAAYAVTLVTCGGSHAEARKIADALAKLDRPFLRGAHQYQCARILAELGDREAAMQALQAAYAHGYAWNGTEVHLDFAFDSLRNYLPFQELIKPKG